jgi:hypothetical protein
LNADGNKVTVHFFNEQNLTYSKQTTFDVATTPVGLENLRVVNAVVTKFDQLLQGLMLTVRGNDGFNYIQVYKHAYDASSQTHSFTPNLDSQIDGAKLAKGTQPMVLDIDGDQT